MLERDSLAGTLGAYLTGVAVTSAPWLLSTAVLVSMRLLARGRVDTDEYLAVERIATVIYAMTLVVSAPIHVVVSRYIADRLYEQRPGEIARPLRIALAGTLLAFLGLGLVATAVLRAPASLAWMVPILTVLVGGQWLLLGVGGGLSCPGVVLWAFGAGTVVTIASALVLGDLGARGCLYGFAIGQVVATAGMLVGVLRALPVTETPAPARLATAFREYRLLAIAAASLQLAVWSDKLALWWLAGGDHAVRYTSACALAWFSVIPAFAWIYVEIETEFYREFRTFYAGLESGVTLAVLRRGAGRLRREAKRILREAAMVQVMVTLLVIAASERIIAAAGLPPSALAAFRLVALGAAPQVIVVLGMLLLYYFDRRREAFFVATVHLAGCFAATALCWALRLPDGLGFAVASVCSAVLALYLIDSRMRRLLLDTFQLQPYSSEREASWARGGRRQRLSEQLRDDDDRGH